MCPDPGYWNKKNFGANLTVSVNGKLKKRLIRVGGSRNRRVPRSLNLPLSR